jgi:hypothetical protein
VTEKFSKAFFVLETLHLLQQIDEGKVKGVLQYQKTKFSTASKI